MGTRYLHEFWADCTAKFRWATVDEERLSLIPYQPSMLLFGMHLGAWPAPTFARGYSVFPPPNLPHEKGIAPTHHGYSNMAVLTSHLPFFVKYHPNSPAASCLLPAAAAAFADVSFLQQLLI